MTDKNSILKRMHEIINNIRQEDYNAIAIARKEEEEIQNAQKIVRMIFAKIEALKLNINTIIECEGRLEKDSMDKGAIMNLNSNLRASREKLIEIRDLEDKLIAGSNTELLFSKRLRKEFENYEDMIKELEKRTQELAS